MQKKVIARIKGGLGNQLFCYAAARRLALVNNAELVIDHVTGFIRDRTYFRQYNLDHFNIHCRKATPWERMEPFERYRRGIAKLLARRLPLEQKKYIEQIGSGFDQNILNLKLRNDKTYFDGLWQSELYFKDIEEVIREELRIIPPEDNLNKAMAKKIASCNAVALHVRWFDAHDSQEQIHNVDVDYYRKAIDLVRERVTAPHFFLFSDNAFAAMGELDLGEDELTVVSHNSDKEMAYADLWLMIQCKHFIIANSTYSWWGAWLGEPNSQSTILAPARTHNNPTAYDFALFVPSRWMLI